MRKYLEFAWRIILTPFYTASLAVASIFVYLADGPDEFKAFWRRNC